MRGGGERQARAPCKTALCFVLHVLSESGVHDEIKNVTNWNVTVAWRAVNWTYVIRQRGAIHPWQSSAVGLRRGPDDPRLSSCLVGI